MIKTVVAIQGVKGSFHDMAAINYMSKDYIVLECSTFDDLVGALLINKASMGIMAIENSIAGSIIPNYALIDQNQLKIIGESYLEINHNLMAIEGQGLKDIKEVHSHPMALLQCKQFFSKYPEIRLVESEDTAEEAKRISKMKLNGVGAIASIQASKIYNLNIIEKSIQTIKNNITRFVIVKKKSIDSIIDKVDKAGLKFILDNKRGSLAAILKTMSDCKLNLTKIQSLPVIERPGKYAFFVDVTFDKIVDYQKAKKILKIMASEFKVLGEYSNKKNEKNS
jgi:prephenate dehydratase